MGPRFRLGPENGRAGFEARLQGGSVARRSLTGASLTRFNRWRRQRAVQTATTLALVILAPLLAFATYLVLGPFDQGGITPVLRLVVLADLMYVLAVAALVMRRVAQMVVARRNRSAGSQLHLRLTGAFALLALIPTVLVAVFSVLIINVGLEGWFSERVRTVLGTSLTAAQAYENEHRTELSRDVRGLADILNAEREANFFMSAGELRQALGQLDETLQRSLTEIYVIDGAGEIAVRGLNSYEFDFERPSTEQLESAALDGIVIIEDWDNNEFRALVPLSAFTDRYLYATREVDGEILSLLDDTQETVGLYEQLENERGRLLFEFGLFYLGFAGLLIIAAIWLGMWFAERLSRPVGRLVSASQQVGAGDLDVRVYEEEGDDEISQLGRDFNRMTEQLKVQRERLLDNTSQIERRRRLFDSVLSSITSGVVGLDAEGRVTFANRSAERLLSMDPGQTQVPLQVAIPEFAPILDRLREEARDTVQEQVQVTRKGAQETLLVRMSPRLTDEGALEGYVVAFDDVTDLVSAQRTAAWGDVARRIAHEIKNPLTPIQLSAERIKRKFRPQVEDAEALDRMTDVIVRQTGDLRRIVDEFSKFARMPEPERSLGDLGLTLRDAVTLQEAGQPDVHFDAAIPDTPVWADFDAGMISQALTNLIKNAGEAIEGRDPPPARPEIRVRMALHEGTATITIEDNGTGLPEDRSRLFEPYVTTRDKGTGLGLPIVKKIIEEHGGTLNLEDADPFGDDPHHGARAVLRLPLAAGGQGAEPRQITA